MNEVLKWTAQQTADNIANRKISVLEVTEINLARAQEVNPKINAMPEILTETAINTAKHLDKNRPDVLPPLFGVPVTTKINVDQKGLVNSNGIVAYKDNVCDEDSAVVANLRNAGAVFIARTNTPEFSMRWSTSNPLHGLTLNPWDDSVTPGGSSGGAAASVAVGVGAIAHGNDLGGSLRYPAFCCGVASIRPSLGRVPAVNPSLKVERPPVTRNMSVQGPIARSIQDLRLALHVMERGDPRDPLWTQAPVYDPIGNHSLRIGYCVDMFGDGVDKGVGDGMSIAVQALKDAGHTLIEMTPPGADRVGVLWGEMLMSEVSRTSAQTIKELASAKMYESFKVFMAAYRHLDENELDQASIERSTLQQQWGEMFKGIDTLLLPTSGQRPFINDIDIMSPDSVPGILKAQKFLCAINLLGLPSVAVPTHLDNGVPIGVQFVAPLLKDGLALDTAEILEREIGGLVHNLVF